MEACISGATLDRPPVSLWRHFPVDDQKPDTLAASIINFQKEFDFDFIKITPASSYCVKDYGAIDEWRGNPEGTRFFVTYPVRKPEDWYSLPKISPRNGYLNAALECIRLVKSGVSKDTPVIQTIFDPMSQAKNLVGRENLQIHLRQNPKELHAGLSRIMENTKAFITECISLGIDGIFFAIQHAQASILGKSELDEFVMLYNQELLDYVNKLWLNVIHIHGKDIYFDKIATLPAAVINWHDQETTPSLPEGKSISQRAVCGGLRQWETLAYGTPDRIATESVNAIRSTTGEKFILGTGCVLPIITPRGNILATRNSVEF
jgi:uroporphyrinogen decarboxylase